MKGYENKNSQEVYYHFCFSYKNDFFLDVDTIHTAALSDSAEDKYLLFMSRLNGTYCYCETDVFTKDTSAYNTWTYIIYPPDTVYPLL